MIMFYLALISSSFRKSSLEEIERIAEFRMVDEFVATIVIESEEKRLAEKLLKSNPTFVYNILPLRGRSEIAESDYLPSIYKAMSGELPKKGSMKIECFDVNCKTRYSAKDIEVYLGQRLEKAGYDIDIVSPDFLVYLVLINKRCYVGYLKYGKAEKKFVNPERHYHPFSRDAVSRSELKLMEAFDEFGIKGRGTAIDIGAAPGGWSKFLAESGYKVIAIDNGDLDYEGLREAGIRVKILDKPTPNLSKEMKSFDIIHLKANARSVLLKGIGKVDLIADDMNMVPKESAEIALSFSDNLSRNAKLVMTIKCVDRKAEKHIARAKEALEKRFRIEGIRVLPGNRQEVTLYATYKDSKSRKTE